jgi:arylsulfatase A-like enzyme
VPSRSCLLTGADVFQAADYKGKASGTNVLNPRYASMPETFRQAGYHTYAIGKWHNDKVSFTRGFCGGAKLFFGGASPHMQVPIHDYNSDGHYPEETRYVEPVFSSEQFSSAAVDFIRRYREEQPFFLYVAYTAPHDPRTPPEAYGNMYDPASIPLPASFMPEHPFDNGDLATRDERLESWPRDPDAVRRHIADYYGMISHMDGQIGRILDTLNESAFADNTIIVYTADHGIALGQHGLMGKQNVYDASIRVPLIACGPGLPSGMSCRELTYTSDIYPTLCELAGVSVPPGMEARSLVPLVNGETAQLRDYAFTVYKEIQRTVTDGRWKLIRYYRSESRGVGIDKIQLFDLMNDPYETADLSGDAACQGKLAELAQALQDWQQQVSDPLVVEWTPMEREAAK